MQPIYPAVLPRTNRCVSFGLNPIGFEPKEADLPALSRIVDIEIRACRGPDQLSDTDIVTVDLPGGSRPDFTVVTITTEDGITGHSFGFGALDAKAAAATMSQVKPFFMGRDAFDSNKNLKDFEMFDRRWNHVPIYSYAPFDNACWDIVGKSVNKPVYKLLGAAREQVPLYVSSMFLPGPEDYVKQALEGFELVRACASQGIEISVVPGPNAALAALAVSGLPTDRFCVEGFLAKTSAARKKQLSNLQSETRTMIFYDSPNRILASLSDAAEIFGPDRPASVSRELTKRFEQTVRGSLAELITWASEGVRGELVLVVAGTGSRKPVRQQLTDDDLVEMLRSLRASGSSLKAAAGEVSKQTGYTRNQLYELAIRSKL